MHGRRSAPGLLPETDAPLTPLTETAAVPSIRIFHAEPIPRAKGGRKPLPRGERERRQAEARKRYMHSDKGKETMKRYDQSEKGRARYRRYRLRLREKRGKPQPD